MAENAPQTPFERKITEYMEYVGKLLQTIPATSEAGRKLILVIHLFDTAITDRREAERLTEPKRRGERMAKISRSEKLYAHARAVLKELKLKGID